MRTLAVGLMAAAWVACAILPVAARDYFVAPDGDDANAGTLEKPMQSPVKAARLLTAGDTLYFRAGLYKCRTSSTVGLAPSADGEPGRPITFKNYNNEHVRIDCTGSDWGVLNDGYSYIVFDGLDITNPTHYGMKLSAASGRRTADGKPVFGHHVTVRNCEIHHTGGECIFAHSTPHLTIENCHLHHSGRSHGLYLQVGCHDAVVRHVTSENNFGNSGMQLNAAGGGIRNPLVELCLIRNNAQGLSLMGVQGGTFRHNVLLNNGYEGPRGAGYREIILWTYGSPGTVCEDSVFENNTIVNLLLPNHKLNQLVEIKAGSRRITFRNNIFYVRGKPIFTVADDSRTGHAFLNNCLFTTAKEQVTREGALAEFAKKAGLEAGGNLVADPGFVDVEKGDVSLKADSPCVDAGVKTDDTAPTAGKARDIGALERGADLRVGCDLPWRKNHP